VPDQQRLLPAGRRARIRGRARRGLDETITALRELGRVEPIDAATLALARVAADELDAACADRDESRYTRATLIGRYQAVLATVVARSPGDDLGAIDDLFAGLGDTPAP
jgi:hypothetical protein